MKFSSTSFKQQRCDLLLWVPKYLFRGWIVYSWNDLSNIDPLTSHKLFFRGFLFKKCSLRNSLSLWFKCILDGLFQAAMFVSLHKGSCYNSARSLKFITWVHDVVKSICWDEKFPALKSDKLSEILRCFRLNKRRPIKWIFGLIKQLRFIKDVMWSPCTF